MKMHVMVVLVKHDGGNETLNAMDTICKYHTSPEAAKNRIINPEHNRPDMIAALLNEIKEFQKSDRVLLYFGISGEELEKALGVKIWTGR